MAGESARDVAQRQRAKAERLQRSAALWERGAEGEEAVAAALAQLPTDTWTVFHDIRWPGRRYANVDHIVVGPPGVFVIDAKNWSGRIAVRDDVLRQNGRSRERDVAAAAEAGLAVAGLVPLLEPRNVHPVLCFVRDEELAGWARDVMVCSTSNLVRMLTSRPALLPPSQVSQLCLELDLGLRKAAMPRYGLGSAGSGPQSPRRATAKRKAVASRSRKRRSSWSALAPAVIGLGMAAVLIMRPEMVTGLADDFVGVFFDGTTSDTSEPDQKKQHQKKPADRKKDATRNR